MYQQNLAKVSLKAEKIVSALVGINSGSLVQYVVLAEAKLIIVLSPAAMLMPSFSGERQAEYGKIDTLNESAEDSCKHQINYREIPTIQW